MDPSQLYTGIVADVYAPLRSAVPDPDLYAGFIDLSGAPAYARRRRGRPALRCRPRPARPPGAADAETFAFWLQPAL